MAKKPKQVCTATARPANETCWRWVLWPRAAEPPKSVVLFPSQGGHVQTGTWNWCWAQVATGNGPQAWLGADQVESMGQRHARNLSHRLAAQRVELHRPFTGTEAAHNTSLANCLSALTCLYAHLLVASLRPPSRQTDMKSDETRGMHLLCPWRQHVAHLLPRPGDETACFCYPLCLDTGFAFKAVALFH